MFFTALVSAYYVVRAATGNTWVPPEGVRLPIETTGLNTLILVLSGVLAWWGGRLFDAGEASRARATRVFSGAIALGTFFLVFQGYEWVKLIGVGLTMSSSVFGATFFLLIGSHALHVVGALGAMMSVHHRLVKGTLTTPSFKAMRIFWYFVVAIWPILYKLVYFG